MPCRYSRKMDAEPLVSVNREQFETLVSLALDQVPPELAGIMDNCVVLVEDRPPADGPANLLGLYEGIPLTERGQFYSAVLPDRIYIFREPILSICRTLDEVVEQVHITVVHEIAHHFGIDDERLHALGYG
jgi:predicted Zn-dependent protease with MMP-like domain